MNIGWTEIVMIVAAAVVLVRPDDLPRFIRHLAGMYRQWLDFCDRVRSEARQTANMISRLDTDRGAAEEERSATAADAEEFAAAAAQWASPAGPEGTSETPASSAAATVPRHDAEDPRCTRSGPPGTDDTSTAP